MRRSKGIGTAKRGSGRHQEEYTKLYQMIEANPKSHSHAAFCVSLQTCRCVFRLSGNPVIVGETLNGNEELKLMVRSVVVT